MLFANVPDSAQANIQERYGTTIYPKKEVFRFHILVKKKSLWSLYSCVPKVCVMIISIAGMHY